MKDKDMSLTKEERRAQFNKVLFTSLQGGANLRTDEVRSTSPDSENIELSEPKVLKRDYSSVEQIQDERSCACFASYKCGEGVHPVRVEYTPQNPISEPVLTCSGGGYNSLLAGYRGNLACKHAPAIVSGHPEPDSGSIHSVENVINRFRVKHGMTANVNRLENGGKYKPFFSSPRERIEILGLLRPKFLGEGHFNTSLGERSQLCECDELQMRVMVKSFRHNHPLNPPPQGGQMKGGVLCC